MMTTEQTVGYRSLSDAERRALAALKFDLAPTPDDVWRPSPFNVADLHRDVVESIFDGVSQARAADDGCPLGVVMQGPAGSGKTHMLGMVRARTQNDGGYFFLVSLLSGTRFWESTALCIADGLLRETAGWSSQLKAFLRRLTAALGLPPGLKEAVAGDAPLKPGDLTALVAALREKDRVLGQEAAHTARALVLYGAQDHTLQDLGYAYLTSMGLADFEERADWGLAVEPRPASLVVRDISRLLALTGSPTVIAFDQLDTLFAQSGGSAIATGGALDPAAASMIGQVANGLMSLREVTRKALIVVACIPDTWKILRREAVGPVPDRFREAPFLGRVSNAKVGMAIVRKRLEGRYGDVGFRPPYPTWPIRELAFAEAAHFTPRALLKRVERHAVECLRRDVAVELENLEDDGPFGRMEALPLRAEGSSFDELDARFASLVKQADVEEALNRAAEDALVPALLAAGLSALIVEMGDPAYKHDPMPSTKPPLHARLRRTLDEGIDDEEHWGFRAIQSGHPGAVMSRINAASTVAGLDPDVPKRKLFLLRNERWPSGPKTTATVNEFHANGGRTLPLTLDDLRTFEALRIMQSEQDGGLARWLADRRPATSTDLFQAALGLSATSAAGAAPTVASVPPQTRASDQARPLASAVSPPAPAPGTIRVGTAAGSGRPYDLDLSALRNHMAIFAGSDRTVLIRRLVEECALRGVSAIVLDPGNELVRLGEAWPAPPAGWGPGDADAARDLLADTEVVVWTPGVESGRPLSFPALPDFEAVRADPDEFRAAIDVAVGALAPRAKVDGSSEAAMQGQAVLRDALSYYARQGEAGGLRSFVAVLAELPEGVTQIPRGSRLAAELAHTLIAAMADDPLFGGSGLPVDPGVLLTPQPHKRARVSVISLVGLTSEEQRCGFVSQLQMALFSWVRRHPAGDRPLCGLLVLDEAQALAPAAGVTACTASTVALVGQARRYGLGLVFATSSPKGLHAVPGSAATQFVGPLDGSAQITAVQAMMAARGGHQHEIGALAEGVFYAATEGQPFEKVSSPMCLTYHPTVPLTATEIVARANTYPGT
jgi:hypothetical protein